TFFRLPGLVRGVRHERDLAGPLDRVLQRSLVRRAHAGDAPRLNLAALRNERRQELHVLVADVVDLLDTELAQAAPAEERAASAALLVLLVLAASTAAAVSTVVKVHHRSPPRKPISGPSTSSSSSCRRLRSCSVGSGGNPRRTRRAVMAALRFVLARSATASSWSTRTIMWRITRSKTRRRRSSSAVISAGPLMTCST